MAILDIGILIITVAAVIVYGILQPSGKDAGSYFLGSRSISWPVAAFSIVATETSTLTFLSLPGLAWFTGLGFLNLAFGYIAGRFLVALLLIPRYFKGEVTTAYGVVEERYGMAGRRLLSIIFSVTRALADSVRLFSSAIPLAMLLSLNYSVAVVLIAAVTLLYTLSGGLRAVVKIDTLQFFLYMISAVVILIWLGGDGYLPSAAQWSELLYKGFLERPFAVTAYSPLSGFIGGAFLSFASHGTDHMMVQRLLACGEPKGASKAVVASGFMVFLQFFLFLVLGLVLQKFMGPMDFNRGDEVFPWFITHHVPTGLRGILLAGIMAAAMSTLSSSINALASATWYDILPGSFRSGNERMKAMVISLFWAVILVALAFLFMRSTKTLVEVGLGIASISYGTMVAVFIMSVGSGKKSVPFGWLLFSVIAGISAVLGAKAMGLYWLWFIPLGTGITLLASLPARVMNNPQ